MNIDISQCLKHPGQSFAFSAEGVVENIDVYGDIVIVENPVHVDGTIIYTGGNFSVRGEFPVKYTTSCGLCGDEVKGEISCEFNEEFAVNEDGDHPDRYTYIGNSINIDKMVYDLICLNLPLKHLCKEDCKGLCMECGANLNREECNCKSVVKDSDLADNDTEKINADNPFAALKDLISDDNKEVQ